MEIFNLFICIFLRFISVLTAGLPIRNNTTIQSKKESPPGNNPPEDFLDGNAERGRGERGERVGAREGGCGHAPVENDGAEPL